MSGLLGGFGNGFAGMLQQAYWRGVPFSVVATSVRKGRKVAVHDYPFRDGGWAEDMGRAQHVYQFSGYLIGDMAPLMQLALDAACEMTGPGLLIHPTLGAVRVALLSATTSVHKEKMRVIEVAFQFLEQGDLLFPSIITATIGNVLSAAADAIPPIAADLISGAVMLAAMAGALVTDEGESVIRSFSTACATSAADPASMVAMATALPPPDANTTYGRYGAGSASTALPAGTTVASMQAHLADQRSIVATTSAAASVAAAAFSAATGPALVASIASVVEAARATMTNPADQIRSLAALCAFAYADNNGGAGLSGDIATVRDAMAAACRRCAVVSLARAGAAYRPVSYNDAANIRALIAAACVGFWIGAFMPQPSPPARDIEASRPKPARETKSAHRPARRVPAAATARPRARPGRAGGAGARRYAAVEAAAAVPLR
jgi:prophage DNA circulation protein